MSYTFHLTSTDSKINSKKIDLNKDMTIQELKLFLVGPIIESVGYDKIKFFQTGKQYDDNDIVNDFNEHERILIFPMIPSLRIIISKKFSDDSDDELESNNDSDIDIDFIETKEEPVIISEIDEEPPKMQIKETDEVLSLNIETLKLFNDNNMKLLLNIYLNNRDKFMEFINYIGSGEFNEFNEDISISYPDDMLSSIKSTFIFLKDLSNDELRLKLDKVGGNLDLLICEYMC